MARPARKPAPSKFAEAGVPTRAWLGVIVVLAGLAAYANSFDGQLLLDDLPHIEHNKSIQQLWPVWDCLRGRRPVVNLSLAVNYAISGLRVGSYHAFNLGVHLLAGLTLFGIVRRTLTLSAWRPRYAGAAPWLALAVALLWVLHPLNTQSVTYIIQRGESMMGLFYLLTLYCVIRGVGSSHGRLWFAGAVAACALSMGCKAVALTAPVMVLAYDRVFLAGPGGFRDVLRKRWPLYAGLAATWLVLVACGVVRGVLMAPPEARATVGFGYTGASPLEYALTQPGVIVHYLRLAVWPHPLCLDYGWPIVRTASRIVPQAAVLLVLLAATVWALRRHAWVGFLGLWFFGILSPTSSFIPIRDSAFEHRMYLSLAAVMVLAVVGGYAGCGAVAGRSSHPDRHRRWLCAALLVVVAVVFGWLTHRRNADYRSRVGMWRQIVALRPEHHRAYHNLGLALTEQKEFAEALASYRQALKLFSDQPETYYNVGIVLEKLGRKEEAVANYEEALRLRPDFPEAHINLGKAYRDQDRYDDAIAHFREAVRLRPDSLEARNNLGIALDKKGDSSGAIESYRAALNLRESFYPAHYNLAMALDALGRYDEAIEHYERTLEINPDYDEALNKLGKIWFRRKDYDQASRCFEDALRVNPDNAGAEMNLGAVASERGDLDGAIEHYRRAVAMKPDSAVAHRNLGILLDRRGDLDGSAESYRKAVQYNPDDAGSWYELGRVLERLGRRGEAADTYRKALELKPDHSGAQAGLKRTQ